LEAQLQKELQEQQDEHERQLRQKKLKEDYKAILGTKQQEARDQQVARLKQA
jgi:hypothetical protein